MTNLNLLTLLLLPLILLLTTSTIANPVALPIPQRPDDGSIGGVLIGDLRTKGATTPVGKLIADILQGRAGGESDARTDSPKGKDACRNSKDACCIWHEISEELTRKFKNGKKGLCNNNARAAVRLGFHDAGTWSQKLADAGQDFGGADGSLVLFDEVGRGENRGLEKIVGIAREMHGKYKRFGVGMADLVQYMAVHATVTCPLGPRIRVFVGRKDATRAAPDGLLPDVHGDPDSLIKLFEEKTISAHSLVALLGAHSTSKQRFVSPKDANKPQDTTPGVWDVAFYNETLFPPAAKSPKSPKDKDGDKDKTDKGKNGQRVYQLPSDIALSKHPKCADEWLMFTDSQGHWNQDYASAYIRLSLLGVNNINELKECTGTLPAARPNWGRKGGKRGRRIRMRSRVGVLVVLVGVGLREVLGGVCSDTDDSYMYNQYSEQPKPSSAKRRLYV